MRTNSGAGRRKTSRWLSSLNFRTVQSAFLLIGFSNLSKLKTGRSETLWWYPGDRMGFSLDHAELYGLTVVEQLALERPS